MRLLETIAITDLVWIERPDPLLRGWFVAKIQIPLSLPLGDPALVYDQQHRVEFLMPLSLAVRGAIGEDLKGYFHVRFLAGNLEIGPRTADQPW